VSTAAAVPITKGELEGDEALEALRSADIRALLTDTFTRFRAADGFSHSRALAFQFTLTLLPAVIAIVGLATAVDQDEVRRVVQATFDQIAPGAVGDLLSEALQQGRTSVSNEHGEAALIGGGLAALLAGASAMGQIERGANRIYGVERDRPLARKYLVGVGLACSAGVLVLVAFVLLIGGSAVREAAGLGQTGSDIWAVLRWPLGIVCVTTAVALLFELSPRRRQPEPSWLAVGAGLAVALWLAFMGLLAVYIDATGSFGATYGPVAGTIGVLLWAFLSALALFLGLAFAAQLEAVRAGVAKPRVERHENLVEG
jgi:YihY family inner membrane protein